MKARWARWDLETSLPTHPPHPSSLHGWQGLPPRGLERAAGALSFALGPCSQCARWHLCLVSSAPFTCAAAAALPSFLSLLSLPAAPRIPAPDTHLPGRSWRSRSAGPELFLTSLGPCPALALCEQPAWQPAVGELATQWPCPLGHRHLPQVST